MATGDIQIVAAGVADAPLDYLVPGSGEIQPKVVTATVNGAGAAAPFQPILEVISDGGVVVARCPAPTVAAGASADVSWFPHVAGTLSASKIAVVGARIEMHAAQAIASNVDTDLVYDTVAFDTAGMVNLGADNRKLTAQADGLYMVTCERAWPYNSSARRLVGILHNQLISGGGAYVNDNAQPAIWATPIGAGGQTTNLTTTLIRASAGDFFATGCNQDSGVALNTGGGAAEFFSAILLGSV